MSLAQDRASKNLLQDFLVPSVFNLLTRNLRLLNLDLLEDWPGLTEAVFTSREEMRVKSKIRLKRAEWLLFRLFELWDPHITKIVCFTHRAR